jgi:hypothetical protein
MSGMIRILLELGVPKERRSNVEKDPADYARGKAGG